MSRTVVTLQTADGRCDASVFRPVEGAGPWPAVIFYMDGVGPRPALFDMGERMAAHGYFVLLPDLFYRAGPYETPDPRTLFADPDTRQAWVTNFISTASQAHIRSDTVTFLEYLAAQPDVKQPKIGTTGYCMGGGLALAAAGYFPDRVAAAASYHGSRLASDAPDSPHLLAARMKARIYVAGAVEDPSFPESMKQRLEYALTQGGVQHEVVTYPGARHGWVPSDTPVHNPEAAERHWTTLFALFDSTLKAS